MHTVIGLEQEVSREVRQAQRQQSWWGLGGCRSHATCQGSPCPAVCITHANKLGKAGSTAGKHNSSGDSGIAVLPSVVPGSVCVRAGPHEPLLSMDPGLTRSKQLAYRSQ